VAGLGVGPPVTCVVDGVLRRLDLRGSEPVVRAGGRVARDSGQE
jgi:hypothetical protein